MWELRRGMSDPLDFTAHAYIDILRAEMYVFVGLEFKCQWYECPYDGFWNFDLPSEVHLTLQTNKKNFWQHLWNI